MVASSSDSSQVVSTLLWVVVSKLSILCILGAPSAFNSGIGGTIWAGELSLLGERAVSCPPVG
jgi:hypothetical protein